MKLTGTVLGLLLFFKLMLFMFGPKLLLSHINQLSTHLSHLRFIYPAMSETNVILEFK